MSDGYEDDLKTIDQLGISEYARYSENENLLYLLAEDRRSLKAFLVQWIAADPQTSETLYELIFECHAAFDGPRHLFFSPASDTKPGYIYYPDLNQISKGLLDLQRLCDAIGLNNS